MPSLPDSSFTGYIIAVHRKMVSSMLGKLLLVLPVLFMKQQFLPWQHLQCVHFQCVVYAVLSGYSQDLVSHLMAYIGNDTPHSH